MGRKGARVVVESLEAQGVKHVFGIPGAKIDSVFDALADGGPQLVLCRHEQNAAFMAAAVGRLTGRAGVCLVTSGPGVSNLVTGLMTATSEGDPVVALGGAVPRSQLLKQTHQVLQGADVMRSVTKYSVEVTEPSVLSEVLSNAFRIAEAPLGGATFVSLPKDVLEANVEEPCLGRIELPASGPAPHDLLLQVAEKISKAQCPMLLLGMSSTEEKVALAVRAFLKLHPLPAVCTYQGAGDVSRELLDCFVGRIGLFNNQPGDRLLREADLILAIGFHPIEYDPNLWNEQNKATLIDLNSVPPRVERYYRPAIELLGSMEENLRLLSEYVQRTTYAKDMELVKGLQQTLFSSIQHEPEKRQGVIHPLRFIRALGQVVGDDAVVTCDVGSHYIWMARAFLRYQPRRLLFSDGQQTLGVALPWAISASLMRPHEKVVSVSGDGGFLFSAMELETAVRLKSNLVHFVWRDNSYDMVKIQMQAKYGRSFGVELGCPDLVAFAESFGVKGLRITNDDDILPVMKKAMAMEGPVLVDVPIDYADNAALCTSVRWTEYGQ